jgi:hypothetical protein
MFLGVVSKTAASALHCTSVQQTVRRARAVPAAPRSKTDAAAQAAYESALKLHNDAATNTNAQWFVKADLVESFNITFFVLRQLV